jgi:transposase
MDRTDEPWDVLKPILPVPSRRSDGRGRPWRDPRAVLNGRLWIWPTGAPWQAWPPRDPPDQTCHRRLHHGVRSDVFARILQVLATDLQERGTLARSEWCIDGTCVVANTGGSGGERRRGARVRRSWPEPTGLVVLSPSTLRRRRRMQSPVLEPTLAAGVVDAQPARWMGDTADESAPLDAHVAEPGIEWIIPHRSNRNIPKPHDGRPWRRDARRWNIGARRRLGTRRQPPRCGRRERRRIHDSGGRPTRERAQRAVDYALLNALADTPVTKATVQIVSEKLSEALGSKSQEAASA